MRTFVSISIFLGLVVWGCGGDSSAPMSVLNDGGVAPAAGGIGQGGGGLGGALPGQGGDISVGGSGGTAGGTITVPGGTRDVATTFCTSTTGDKCAVSAEKITCGKTNCNANLIDCYSAEGSGGKCKSYATCRLACSCEAKERGKCENKCMADYGMTDTVCTDCLTKLWICSSQYGCTPPTCP
jgi:hypothetical protein